MYKYFIYLMLLFPLVTDCFFYKTPNKFPRNFISMNYRYAKEYYNFFVEYKETNKFLLKGQFNKNDYEKFARKNNDSYYIFE